MGLPMYVSPSLPKRQLPPKQPQSPYEEVDYSEDLYQNSRTSAYGNRRYIIRRPYAGGEYYTRGGVNSSDFYSSSEVNLTDRQPITEISEWSHLRDPSSQTPLQNEQLRPQRIRSSSLPYNNLVQRLGNLPHLHRTREPQITSSGLASRRGMQLQSAQLIRAAQQQALQQVLQAQQARAQQDSSNASAPSDGVRNGDSSEETNESNSDDLTAINPRPTELPSNSAPRDNNHISNNVTNNAVLDNVFRRVNIFRQLTHDNRSIRPGSRNHRRDALTREGFIQRGIDMPPIPPLIRVSGPYIPPTFPSEVPESLPPLPPLPPLPRRLRHSVRRGNVINPYDSRSNFGEELIESYDIGHFIDDDLESSTERSHTSHILSPIPRRYDPTTLTASFAMISPNGMLMENRERINVDGEMDGNNVTRREIPEGSSSGEVC
ncbi:6775_t:CDS:1 [Acaulospora colombiana]|uniref:6775_t:CDS:1 n=1 Tax=Acaulospora colombiana TaxID=27376 RepID=A0ACA9MEV7_9GLOM|nr:6775_t:CDS:1 [Acaulospora colombiana]